MVARVEFSIAGQGDDKISYKALSARRQDVIAPIAARLPGAQVAVAGQALSFRSIVVPLKAILLNLLSVGAAYGILVTVFRWSHLEGPLGFTSNGAIVPWLPLFLLVVLFGLSMDYHVFILTRIKELVDRRLVAVAAPAWPSRASGRRLHGLYAHPRHR